MGRKVREGKVRKQRRVLYVSMEGTHTERKYFDSVIEHYNLRNVRLLKRKTSRSSPSDVLKQLDRQKGTRKQVHGVELYEAYWAVFDHDNLSSDSIERAFAEANRKGYRVADSKPCFELWLLLHHGSRGEFKGLEASGDQPACLPAQKHLENKDLTYNRDKKGAYKADEYMSKINTAIRNAKEIDKGPSKKPLDRLASRVHRLIEFMKEFST